MAAQEVVAAQKQGNAVVDIRPNGEWAKGHVPGAINIEFLRLITGESPEARDVAQCEMHAMSTCGAYAGWTPWQVLRKLAFAFFGIANGTGDPAASVLLIFLVLEKACKLCILSCKTGNLLRKRASAAHRRGQPGFCTGDQRGGAA